jgi:hypothetical protein
MTRVTPQSEKPTYDYARLLMDKGVRHSVLNSIRFGLGEMTRYVLQAEKPSTFIGMYAAFDLFPFYKGPHATIGMLKEPNADLMEFWRETSAVCCYQFGPLERAQLGVDGSAPTMFISDVERAAREIPSKQHVADKMQAIIGEIKGGKFRPEVLEKKIGWLSL